MPFYRITSGTFREPDDSIKGPDDEIQVDEAFAKQHAESLVLIDPQPEPARTE